MTTRSYPHSGCCATRTSLITGTGGTGIWCVTVIGAARHVPPSQPTAGLVADEPEGEVAGDVGAAKPDGDELAAGVFDPQPAARLVPSTATAALARANARPRLTMTPPLVRRTGSLCAGRKCRDRGGGPATRWLPYCDNGAHAPAHGRFSLTSSHASSVQEAAVESALARLSLEAKVRLLSGQDVWTLPGMPEIGLASIVMSDGPVGVRGTTWSASDPSIALPSPTALAATWDPGLAREAGQLLGQEARRKGVHVLLAPTVNLHRSPLGGRHFECYSEDPLLTARIGIAYVAGVQDQGVATTVKHFVANDSETERFTVSVEAAERTLRELYLAPFEAIVREGGAWGVMSAYNSVHGV